MAVETRYVVIRTDRSNEEQEVMTFTDKRAADEYDKMLDMADAMFEVLESAELELNEQQCEELSIYLAKQREEVLYALQAKKKPTTSKKSVKKSAQAQTDMLEQDEKQEKSKSLSESLLTENNDDDGKDKDESLVDYVIEKDDAA